VYEYELKTKLILIEGLPGAGKTSSSLHLGNFLQQNGIACRWYLENDNPHPIDCSNFKLKDLAQKLPPLWLAFVKQALGENIVTIIESRLWQNTALFMFMSEFPIEEIVQVYQLVLNELSPLSPVLIILHQDDIEKALGRLYSLRDKDLIEKDIQATNHYKWFRSRGLKNLDGWVQFFSEWQGVAELLYSEWPFRKTKIINPHNDWQQSYQHMYNFVQAE